MTKGIITRRSLLGGAAGMAGLAALPSLAQDATPSWRTRPSTVRNNVSSFRMLQWQDYFDNTRNGGDPRRHHLARAALLVG